MGCPWQENLGMQRVRDYTCSVFRYTKVPKDDTVLMAALEALVKKHPSIGFWKCYYRLRRQGYGCNHKRLYRVYKLSKLNIRRKIKRRFPQRVKQPLFVPDAINQGWSMDFMSHSLVDGRRFRLLNIIDDYNRESLWIEVDTSLPSLRVISVLERLLEMRGKPLRIRVDNGPAFISDLLKLWCEEHGIELLFIQPGKPVQNAQNNEMGENTGGQSAKRIDIWYYP